MGIIIFTADDAKYRDNSSVVMRGTLSTLPTVPDTTFILHSDKFNEKDVLYWAPIIPYRLVVVTSKPPTLTNASTEYTIVDSNLKVKKPNFRRPIDGLFKWGNRVRVWNIIKSVPLTLISSFLRINRSFDIKLGRRIARCRYTLPDDYLYASITYSVEPSHDNVEWPKKGHKAYEKPMFFRKSDKYAEAIISGSPEVANDLRANGDELPKGVKKKAERTTKWL